MNILGVGRQTERVGIDPTLSAVVAGGVALQMYNQPIRNIDENYGDYEGNTPIECLFSLVKVFFRQCIITTPLPPRLGDLWKRLTYSLPFIILSQEAMSITKDKNPLSKPL
jgi:hypothetical protein